MPKYDFRCPQCGIVEERFQSIDDYCSELCYDCFPEHGLVAMNKVFRAPSVIIKGQKTRKVSARQNLPL